MAIAVSHCGRDTDALIHLDGRSRSLDNDADRIDGLSRFALARGNQERDGKDADASCSTSNPNPRWCHDLPLYRSGKMTAGELVSNNAAHRGCCRLFHARK